MNLSSSERTSSCRKTLVTSAAVDDWRVDLEGHDLDAAVDRNLRAADLVSDGRLGLILHAGQFFHIRFKSKFRFKRAKCYKKYDFYPYKIK
jgi:hypothetical protein